MPRPSGPPRTGRNQKSDREKVAFLTLPLVLYIVPARFTIWTTNLSLAPSPWSGGLHLQGFGFVPGVPAICFWTWMKLPLPFGLVVDFEVPRALSLALSNPDASGNMTWRPIVGILLSTVGAGSEATFTVPMSSAKLLAVWTVVALAPGTAMAGKRSSAAISIVLGLNLFLRS